MGKSVLEGLNGVVKVENGFKNSKEINRVIYNPARISIEELEEALKKAGTYAGIVR